MSWAVFSCDLDPVDRHLQGYGFDDPPPCDLIYRVAVPRLLDLLAEVGAPAVLFTLGRDAHAQRGLLRRAAAAGHEVASHSLTHPQPFRGLDDGALREQLEGSRRRLADAVGQDVAGFRAPGWDVDDRVLAMVRTAGYRYDASLFPTPALLASRVATRWRSAGRAVAGGRSTLDALRQAARPIRPHAAQGLVEFPVAVTPRLRFPVYHTVSHLVPERLFRLALGALLRSDRPVCYQFHAADLLDLMQDDVDPRMGRHPGMGEPLRRKRARLRGILATIAAARRPTTYRAALQDGAWQ